MVRLRRLIGCTRLIIISLAAFGCAREPEFGESPDKPALAVKCESLSLRPGEMGRAGLTITNRAPTGVSIQRFETSCPCVRVSPSSIHIPSHQTASLYVTYDPTEEPDFRGGLAVALKGIGERDRTVFSATADIEVRDRDPKPINAGGSN